MNEHPEKLSLKFEVAMAQAYKIIIVILLI
jgi:hypothetical protein